MAKGTVLVNLRKDWFGPDGSLYQARDNPHEFPASYAEPAEAKKEPVKEVVTTRTVGGGESKQKYAVLPSSAEIVESENTVMTERMTGGGQKILEPTAVEDDVKSVGGAVGEHGLTEPDQKVSAAAKVAKDAGIDQVGGKPRESGPLPAGTKVVK